MWKFLVLLAASLCTCSAYTRFEKCGSSTDNYVMSVKIGDCRRPPCIFKPNTNLTVEIDFYSSHEAETLRMVYYAMIPMGGGTETMKVGPMEGPDTLDACTGNGIECPIRAGGRYLYTKIFYTGEMEPTTDAIAAVKMLSIAGRNKNFAARQVFCIQYATKF